jgi:hypothetical protein
MLGREGDHCDGSDGFLTMKQGIETRKHK